MRTIQINLGLNNNPYSAEQVIGMFARSEKYRLMAYTIEDMTYEGHVEPTFVAMFEVMTSECITDTVRTWSILFQQECIALSTDTFETLVYADRDSNKPYTFDKSMFRYLKIN